ncbi:MAG: twin-arginine translocase subunit TatC [Desulfobacteraceae bacterium]|nr:MAG: twin-arginine translocase subunit TatC [Desulfobacteraceae bacterium]
MSFMSHLDELRKRLIRCCYAVAIGFGVCYYFSETIYLDYLAEPLLKALPAGSTLIATSLTEPFMTYMKIGFFGGILLALPFIFYQFWKFIAPGLYKNEKKWVIPFVLISSLLFMGGAFFGYRLVFPAAFKFLMSYSNAKLQVLPKMSEYFSLTINLLLAFGISFELPIVITFLAKIGVVTADFLKKKRKYFIVLAFVVAAIITPTVDPVSQTLMAVPLIILYEIGILSARWVGKRKAKKEEEKNAEAEA